jgi:hypothetical protein
MENRATKQIIDILSACGCKPAATVKANGDTIIKVNAPIHNKPSCDTCDRRETCTKTIGNLYGFCNTDYIKRG